MNADGSNVQQLNIPVGGRHSSLDWTGLPYGVDPAGKLPLISLLTAKPANAENYLPKMTKSIIVVAYLKDNGSCQLNPPCPLSCGR